MRKQVQLIILTLFLAVMAAAQDGRFDASINGGATFTNTVTGNSVTQSATSGLNVFGTIRYKFRPRHSLIFNIGHERNSQTYLSFENFHVVNSAMEWSGGYMFSPLPNAKWQPFFMAGAGALIFSPSSTWIFFPNLPNNVLDRVQVNLGATNQTKPAFLYGVGVDYKLPWVSRVSLRLQYRGLLYKAPDFNVVPNGASTVSFFTGQREHMAEPSIGFVYRF